MKKKTNKERFYPLKKLAAVWQTDFLENKQSYLDVIIPEAIKGNFSSLTKDEKEIFLEIKENLSKNEWKNLKVLFLEAINSIKTEDYNKETILKAKRLIFENDFLAFEKLFLENKNLLKNTYSFYKEELKKYTNSIRENIVKSAVKDKNETLSYFYKSIKKLPEPEKETLGIFLEDIEGLLNILEKFDFPEADRFFFRKKIIKKDEYEALKKVYVLKYFKDKNIDDEKALAISSVRPNVLLRARAGSGKTSTICLKTSLLIQKYNVNPDEILILAFNKDAKEKIIKDFKEKFNINSVAAKTFHGFANSISREGKIAGEIKQKTLIVKAIDKVLSDENNKKLFYSFYKTSLDVPFKTATNISNKENVKFSKDLSQTTLRGEIVKSRGEKYIADFLFEHGVEYEYEKPVIFTPEEKEELNIDEGWNVYRPDFYITQNGKEFYLEHWAVDEKVLDEDYFGTKGPVSDVQKYIKNMHTKRRYFRKKNIPLIETWAKHSQIKENFDITLYETFKKAGITLKKIDENLLYERVKSLNIKTFYKTIEAFISSVKKSKFTSDKIQSILQNEEISKRTKFFLKLGFSIYFEYKNLLSGENLTDFDDLITNAAKKIMETKGECKFQINEDKFLKVKDIKYLMIDEYQDFSKLFFDLVLALKCFNPKVQIFAAGDNWQAINGFAGSNLYYFDNFKKLFNNSEIYNLTSNYRSYPEIIDVSNTFMASASLGEPPSKPVKTGKGEVVKINIDKTFINKENPSDLAFTFKKDPGKVKAKYFKTIHRIIRLNPDKKILILSRLNKILSSGLEGEFAPKLFRMNTINPNNVKVMTIHKSKGLEADIVIILRAINGVVPFIHPDFEIQAALDKSYHEIMEEEKRLFYVALTRAKEKVYILTESKLESVYLKDLNLKEVNFRHLILN